jgi:threonine synthase
MAGTGIIARYGPWLRIQGLDAPVSLGEGATPLVHAPRLAEWVGCTPELFLKYEGLNPTGSFKDRGMTTAVTDAVARGARTLVCASTGNTAASAAAYAARAGIRCAVLIPEGKVALGKLAGALAYGARVVQIEGSFDDALRLVRELSETEPVALVNSVNPARMEGQQTAAWEVCEALGRLPAWLSLPVGNAGNISAYWQGFRRCAGGDCPRRCGAGVSLPRMLGTQAEGAAPLVHGHPIEHPETRATAIRIGNPARAEQAVAAARESNGRILAVSDAAIFDAYRQTAQREGVFCEPSSAASVAGLKAAIEQGTVAPSDGPIVCVLTGHGLKDPDSATEGVAPPIRVEASAGAIAEAIR